MEKIPSQTVESVWKKMGAMPPHNAPKLIEQLKKEQPLILAYLMAVRKIGTHM